MKRIIIILLITLIIPNIITCKNSNNPNKLVDPYSYIEGSIGDAQRLIPMLASDSASGTISNLVFNGLVKYDKDINIIGDLAEDWTFSKDCREILFNLKKNIKWHDGAEFTSQDIKFTYEKLIDNNVATPYRGDFERVKSFEILDMNKVKITYKEPFAPGLSSWTMGIIPQHILKDKDLNTTEFNRNPIGTGPYKFVSWNTGQKIVLKANSEYFEGKPNIDRYIYRIIPDSATMFLELKAMGIDSMGLTPTQYKRQTDNKFFEKFYNRFKYPSFGYTYIGYNLKDPKFSNKKVRQALSYAIDKQSIIDGVLLGLGRKATGPFPPESWAYNSYVKEYEYSIDKAIELLKQEGWFDSDNDGIIDKNGIPFSFRILTNQGNNERKKTAVIIQQNLSKIGIKTEISILEWQALLHQFIHKKKFEAIILGWGLGRDPDPYDIWHSSKTGEGEFNFISYYNKQVDELLVKGRTVCNKDKRRSIYHKIHELIAEDQPYTFLYYPEALPIINKRFKGIEPSAIGIFYNFIKWYVPQDENKWYQ